MKKLRGSFTISVTYTFDFEIDAENKEIALAKLKFDPLAYSTKEISSKIEKVKNISFKNKES